MICRFCGLQLTRTAHAYVVIGARETPMSKYGVKAENIECVNAEGLLTLHDPLPEDADATD